TSSDANFIPHALAQSAEAADPLTKICIGHTLSSPRGFDMLVNLQTEELPQGDQFERVAELVSSDPVHKSAARNRYAAWRAAGAEQNLHEIRLN
ncbi:MAG: DNA polymerase III subunit chi, partial [Desulfobacterales bacterium]|nr:DNA polymerase III subunit chi [Desulfobacterales bacterium]